MRTIMSRTAHDSSFSFSRRHFRWVLKKGGSSTGGAEERRGHEDEEEHEEGSGEMIMPPAPSDCPSIATTPAATIKKRAPRAAAAAAAVSRFRAAVLSAVLRSSGRGSGSGSRLTGTLFGHRRGHVHFAFQVDPKSAPVLLIELATPTSGLVREMASGLVRIALECEKKDRDNTSNKSAGAVKLLEEPLWRTYCNGKKCGYAVRRECGPADWKVLRAVEPVSMGAGVLPASTTSAAGGGATNASAADGEMMYMRARFERVVGSKDSEAFYMMSPDGSGGPELSIYLLRL